MSSGFIPLEDVPAFSFKDWIMSYHLYTPHSVCPYSPHLPGRLFPGAGCYECAAVDGCNCWLRLHTPVSKPSSLVGSSFPPLLLNHSTFKMVVTWLLSNAALTGMDVYGDTPAWAGGDKGRRTHTRSSLFSLPRVCSHSSGGRAPASQPDICQRCSPRQSGLRRRYVRCCVCALGVSNCEVHLPHGLVLLFCQMRMIHPGVFEAEFSWKCICAYIKYCVCVCVYKERVFIQMCVCVKTVSYRCICGALEKEFTWKFIYIYIKYCA